MANENKVKSSIQTYLTNLGAYHVKIHGSIYQRAGIPDILCCLYGHFIGIEVKDDGNVTSALQEAHGRQIVKAGGIFIVAYSVQDVKEELTKMGVI